MTLVGNGTSQYVSIGTAVTIVQSPPLTFAALIDTTNLRFGGASGSEWNSIIQQGTYATNGWDVEIENGASNNRLNLSAKATGGAAFDAFGPTVTHNTGWWLIAGVLRDTGTNLATDLYTYQYNTGTLSLVTTATFSRGTNGTLPAPTGLTTLFAQNGTTDWFPGSAGWVAVWNVDLFGAGAANPPALQSLIAQGPFSQADSSLKGLWLLDGDATDYSSAGHNGTLIAAPTFTGTPVNYLPLVAAYRTTATAAGGANALAATGGMTFDGGTAALAASDALVATGGMTFGGSASLSVQGAFAATGGMAFSGSAALSVQTAPAATGGMTFGGTAALVPQAIAATGGMTFTGTAALTQTNALAASGGMAFGGAAALSVGSNTARPQIAVGASGSGGNDFAQTLVRDSANRLWVATWTASSYLQNPGNQARIYRADQTGVPTTFTEQDTAHRPANVVSLAAAIDAADVIHVAWVNGYVTPGSIQYNTFDTTTGLWGTATAIGTLNSASTTDQIVGDQGVALALDANGKPHVLHYGRITNTSGAYHIWYVNKVSGSWTSDLRVDTATLSGNFHCMHPNMMFDGTGALHAVWTVYDFNYQIPSDGTAYYAKRSAAGVWGTPVAFAETLLGSVDNGPDVYVDEFDTVHVTYNLGDTTSTQTGNNNVIFYRFSTDGGATWNTSQQPPRTVTHDPALGPDGAGGLYIWGHGAPATYDGQNGTIGRLHKAAGATTWTAWAAYTTGTPSADSTVSVRRATFGQKFRGMLDVAYFGDALPLTTYVGVDPGGNALVGQKPAGGVTFAGTASLTPQSITATGGASFGGTAAISVQGTFAASGGMAFGGSAALSVQATIAASGGMAFGGTAALVASDALSATGGMAFGGAATLSSVGAGFNASGGMAFGGTAAVTLTLQLAASGAASFGGAAALTTAAQIAASGGMALGGAAALAATVPLTAAGGALFGGAATLAQVLMPQAAGGIVFGGVVTLSNGVTIIIGTVTAGVGATATIGAGEALVTTVTAGERRGG